MKVKIEGLRELENALKQLPQATGKNVVSRTLIKAAKPFVEAIKAAAPVKTGSLKESAKVGKKLSRRQRQQHKKMFQNDKASVEVFAGPGTQPQAITQEFGAYGKDPKAFVQPAWDTTKQTVLDSIKTEMWSEIEKAARRLARKGK